MSQSIPEMAEIIYVYSSGRLCGRGSRKTESLTYSQKKNLHGIMSGQLGGQQSSASSSAIMSDPAQGQMLIRVATATDKTKCPWPVQINLQNFSYCVCFTCWSPFCHSLYQFCEMFWEITNNPVFRTLFSGKMWLKIGVCNLQVTSLAVVHALFVMMLTVVFGLLVTRFAKPLSPSATWTLTDSLSFLYHKVI
jgi:hypothetical protein